MILRAWLACNGYNLPIKQFNDDTIKADLRALAEDLNLQEIILQIQRALDLLQSYIESHGGRVEFVEFKDNIVFVRLHGTCLDCPLSFYTLTYGIERQLKEKIPTILKVDTVE